MSEKNLTTKKLRELSKSSDYSAEVLIPKLFTSKAPPFAPESNFKAYMSATYEERRKYLQNSCEVVSSDEKNHQYLAHYNVTDKIREDPELTKKVEIFPLAADIDLHKICRVLGKRAILAQGRETGRQSSESNFEINEKNVIKLLEYIPVYQPPSRRIRITQNITFNTRDVIPVYSDLPNEDPSSIEIPDSMLFDYIDVNFVNLSTERELARAVIMSEKRQNQIRCDCHSHESIVECYKNEKCPCYQLNRKMQEYQPDKTMDTEFSTFEPIFFNGMEKMYGKHFGFACSELCGCNGNCSNNSLLIAEKRVFPLEAFRSNKDVGFGVRSSVLIPAGTPVMEFIGEINRFDNDSSDYSYQITYDLDREILTLISDMEFTEPYKALLIKLHRHTYFIDPKNYGNVGRLACHSCSANMELIRVFQKSLSPAHIRIVMVAMIDIYPGTPLTFDYGDEYIKQHLGNNCGCGSFVCRNGKDAKIFTKLTEEDFMSCYKQLDVHQYNKWDADVYKPVCDFRDEQKKKEEDNRIAPKFDKNDICTTT